MVKKKILFIDTDILIGILHKKIDFEILKEVCSSYDQLATTSANVFEIYSGFYKLKYSKKKISNKALEQELKAQKELISNLIIFDFNLNSSIKAAEIYYQLVSNGMMVDSFDCIIASIIISSGYSDLLTNNSQHFNRIKKITPINMGILE